MKNGFVVVLALLSSPVVARAGDDAGLLQLQQPPPIELTGNPRVDFFAGKSLDEVLQQGDESGMGTVRAHKSPWIASGLSMLVPGAGEFYAESYWRAALFFAIEAASWGIAYHYDKKGDTQTEFFEGYADAHWDVVAYGQYAQDHLAPAGHTYNWLIPGTEGLHPWERVNWTELNNMERAIGGTSAGQYYSHTLPLYGEQQYYELIGKYYQYNQGWQDVSLEAGRDGSLNHYYETERARADDFYDTASTMVSIVIVNHILSAIDAGLAAGSYNRFHAGVGMSRVPRGAGVAHVPTVQMHYSF